MPCPDKADAGEAKSLALDGAVEMKSQKKATVESVAFN
jgi:hypothetical protein